MTITKNSQIPIAPINYIEDDSYDTIYPIMPPYTRTTKRAINKFRKKTYA